MPSHALVLPLGDAKVSGGGATPTSGLAHAQVRAGQQVVLVARQGERRLRALTGSDPAVLRPLCTSVPGVEPLTVFRADEPGRTTVTTAPADGCRGCSSRPLQAEVTVLGSTKALRPGSGATWWIGGPGGAPTGPTSCGIPAFLRLEGRVQQLGGCAADLPDPPVRVRLRLGELLDLHVTQEDTERGLRPFFPLPLPDAAVLPLVRVEPGAATGTYRADEVGTVALVAASDCPARPRRCPFVIATVVGPTH